MSSGLGVCWMGALCPCLWVWYLGLGTWWMHESLNYVLVSEFCIHEMSEWWLDRSTLIESPRPAGDKRREYICVCCPTSSSKASWGCANGMLEEEKISKVSIVQEGQGVFHVIAQFSKLDMKIHSCSWLMAGSLVGAACVVPLVMVLAHWPCVCCREIA